MRFDFAKYSALFLSSLIAAPLVAQSNNFSLTHGVPLANPRSGAPANQLAKGFCSKRVVQGSDTLENPSGVITNFGHLNDFPATFTIEPTKTEPDENTYLVFQHNPEGPTAGYDYGHHFLFQGHENSRDLAYITRVNLDVQDPAHRITLLTPVGADGKTHLNSIDGSTYDPFTNTLLFTSEAGSAGGVIEINAGWPANAHNLNGIVGQGGFEGIHPDNQGNILIIEDAGGTSVNVDPANPSSPKAARQPNSFIYKFVPTDRTDLSKGGVLYALQVSIDSVPLTFHAADPVGDTFSDAQVKLHTLGTSWPARWVKVHDTSTDGTTAFSANALAKAAGATPFKRSENAQFLPGSGFSTFFVTVTGDTDTDAGNTPALAARGAWGSLFRVDIPANALSGGSVSVFYLGDKDHAAFDNIAFGDRNTILVGEDRGDKLHRQLNALDSIWTFELYANREPERLVALGRDAASLIDANFLDASTPGFQNDGDNETTGIHVSNGSTSVALMQGSFFSTKFTRTFFTQQHGLNQVSEVQRCEERSDEHERE